MRWVILINYRLAMVFRARPCAGDFWKSFGGQIEQWKTHRCVFRSQFNNDLRYGQLNKSNQVICYNNKN
jgi:hypothetical protein